jgi:hypothetical protein
MLVPLVVRGHADGFELVAGFHRIAAAHSLGFAQVPVVVRDGDTEDADRAVENITLCRRWHDVINADRVVIADVRVESPRFVVNPVARSAQDPGQIQAVRLRQTTG